MKRETFEELKDFDQESFNDQYKNLISVGIDWGCEDEMMNTLSFISRLQTTIDNIKADMSEEPEECQHCKTKDERIHNLKKSIEILYEIKSVQKAKIEELENMIEKNDDTHPQTYKEYELQQKEKQNRKRAKDLLPDDLKN